jgi:hypothetical protein
MGSSTEIADGMSREVIHALKLFASTASIAGRLGAQFKLHVRFVVAAIFPYRVMSYGLAIGLAAMIATEVGAPVPFGPPHNAASIACAFVLYAGAFAGGVGWQHYKGFLLL